MVVDPHAYAWQDDDWPGVTPHGQVIYELHIGTFTPEGTFAAALGQLAELKALGITMLELMPVAECPGRFNWGYDGVQLYAPYHVYGTPDDFKRFVDAAHGLGLAVILDVVYNHLGPDGNYLPHFSPHYFTDRHGNEWGEAIDFDGPHSQPVRDFFIGNACYWIREFHLDGLRLDATQAIHDASPLHVLAELSERARAVAQPRGIFLVAENEPQAIRTVQPVAQGGHGLDAMWNDDYHHSARVAVTGRHEGYLHDHRGRAQEFISAIKRGFLYQGQHYQWQKQARGSQVTHQPASAFVVFTQNHDQVGNTFYGQRLCQLTSPGRHRAITALTLLAPQTPLLFMGQEFAASTPFAFFADHGPELAAKVLEGRRAFVAQFASYASPAAQEAILDPADERTFQACKLDFTERQRHAPVYALYRDLLRLRRDDPVIAAQCRECIDGAVLSERAFVLRWFDAARGDRLLVVNLADELDFRPGPEPLLAPPSGSVWRLAWSSDDPCYDGPGLVNPCQDDGWRLPGECAVLLRAEPVPPSSPATDHHGSTP
jgi:maltooligosyltrehalose trehalohydrolase